VTPQHRGEEIAEARSADELLERFRRGDAQAFDELVRRTTPLVSKVVRVLVRPDDLDDVIQDVYARLYTNQHRYQPLPSQSFTAWLTVLARNVAIDYIRQHRNAQRHESRRDEIVLGLDYIDQLGDPDANTEENALELLGEGDLLPALRRGLDALSPRERELLMLHYVSGYAYKEIAGLKRISEGTVRTLLGRARSKLRRYVED